MYKIGDFSKITNLTVKALRYYDDEGLLKPSYRAENAYRYYDESDFRKAQMIVFLRDLDFSITEIKDILANYSGEDDMTYYLMEKKSLIEQKVNYEKSLMKRIDQFLIEPEKEKCSLDYIIEVKEIPAMEIASIRLKGTYKDIGKYLGMVCKEVKNKAQGAPFCCYHDASYSEEADIEACIPVKNFIGNEKITVKQLPGIKGICTKHMGGYDVLNLAYKALIDYAMEHQLECGLPLREVYLKGPGMVFMGNPNKYLTEIVMPLV